MTLNQFLYVNIIHGSEPVDPIHVLKDYGAVNELPTPPPLSHIS